MSTKPYDQAFKYLAEQDPEALLLLCGAIREGETVRIEPLSQELTVSVKVPDQLYLIERNGVSEIVHIESQTIYIQEMPSRMLDYHLRIWIKYQMPITSYLFLLTEEGLPENTGSLARTGVDTRDLHIGLQYHIVKLWEMDASLVLANENESVLPFVPLMASSSAEILVAAQKIFAINNQTKRQELSLHFFFLGGLRYTYRHIIEIVGGGGMIPWEQLRRSSFYQMILDEGLAEGRQQGVERGRQEGLVEGRQEGLVEGRQEGLVEGRQEGQIIEAAKLVIKLLSKRFPTLNIKEEIFQVRDLQVLEQMALDVLEITDAELMKQNINKFLSQNDSKPEC